MKRLLKESDFHKEKDIVEELILKALKKHPKGMTEIALLDALPANINDKVVTGLLLLLADEGLVVPVSAYTLNK